MATKENLEAVLASNSGILKQMGQLNVRAGKCIFHIPDASELMMWLKERLAGAARVADIANLEAIRLSPPDIATVGEIMRENPDSIAVFGKDHNVLYRPGYPPTIILDCELVAANRWNELPDEGILLPGGRRVCVSLGVLSSDDIPLLKTQMREYLNRRQWEAFRTKSLVSADFFATAEKAPEITEVVYGTCVVTGVPLVTYGVVEPVQDYWSGTIAARTSWFLSRETAEAAWKKAEAALATILKAKKENEALRAAQDAAETARGTLQSILARLYAAGIVNEDIASEVYRRTYDRRPTELAALEVWTQDANGLIVRAEAAIVERARLLNEAAALQNRAGELYRAVESGAYVILGELRKELEGILHARIAGRPDLLRWFSEAAETVRAAEREAERKERRHAEGFSLDNARAALLEKFGSF